MGFAAAVEAATQTEMVDQAVIQRKTAIGSATAPYKHYVSSVENQDIPRTNALRCNKGTTEGRNNKPQVKAKVYALEGLPVDTEAEVVEVSTPMGVNEITEFWWNGMKREIA
ncbi:hypothetical protein M9H77_22999 [Catharanthus roseus]|uniref:Uncharacterized protein n=1 Tax=Catharanthus roseus TaxID=4058 RepID=A0ACC0AW27_CATRO|nr:hypothetical protein M9H77_22999 [Catharanthus roseus]